MSVVTGLALGVRGIVGKEVRSRSRGWRPMLLLTFYLVVLALAVVTVLGVAVAQTGTISPNLGQLLFGALAAGSVLLVAFIAPALTAGALSGERERRTLDLLLVTRASPLGLAAGKLAGAMLWVIYLLVASLPALGIVYLFGGVPLMTVVAALVVTIATALGYSALGLLLSAVFRRTVVATVLAYGAVMVRIASTSRAPSTGWACLASTFRASAGRRHRPGSPSSVRFWPWYRSWAVCSGRRVAAMSVPQAC